MDYYKNQTYYDILGVKEDASLSSIERAKDRLKFGSPEDRAPFEMWSKIDEAYSVLSDPKKREEYNKNIESIPHVPEESTPSIVIEPSMEDIYSSSDHKIHSIFNENNTITKEKLKRTGKTVVLALPTGIVTTIQIIKELNKDRKYDLKEDSSSKEVKDVKTEESRLEEIYRKELEESIERKLFEYHLNYNLEIDKLRYKNHIELLKQKINLKENQTVKKGGLLKYKLELTSLKKQLSAFEKSLENIEQKIIENQQSRKKSKLTTIHEKLIQIDSEIEKTKLSSVKKTIALKRLTVRRDKLMEKFRFRIDKVKSNRARVAVLKDSFIKAKAVTENFVDNLFVPIEQIDERIMKH